MHNIEGQSNENLSAEQVKSRISEIINSHKELDKRKLEFYIFEELMKRDFSSSEVRKIINLIPDEVLKDVKDTLFIIPFYKMLSQICNDDTNILYLRAIARYGQIVKKVNLLAKELKLTNSLEVSLLFSYLLYNGYFSITSEHKYKVENRIVIPGCYSLDIFHGGGVCLNYSDMLTDILVDAGYSATIMVNIVDKSTKCDYIPRIERKHVEPKFYSKISRLLSLPISRKFGDHAVTLIIDNGQPYIYCPTNLTMFECADYKEAVHTLGEGKLTLKPYVSSFFATNDANFKALKTLCLTDDYTSPYNKKDFIFTSEQSVELFDLNKNLMHDFHEDSLEDITTIVEDTITKKKRIVRMK